MARTFQPEEFGPYKLTHLVGKGGMASVFRALRSGPMGFSKQVAIKRLHPSLTENEGILKSLINEARLGGQLKHPNIVEVYEFNKVDEVYYLAMEFVDGWTLDRVTKLGRQYGEPMPPEVILDVLLQICEGLHYAHNLETLDGQETHLVHRDLKPANVILSRSGTAKIMDFGIAKADTNLFKTTLADTTKGTPHYMSPEQVAGDPDIFASSDIFSLGSLIFELVTGGLLFEGESLVTVLFAVARAKVGDRLAAVDNYIPGLADVLARCLAKDPSDRYQSAAELAAVLRGLRREIAGPETVQSYLYGLRTVMIAADEHLQEVLPTVADQNSPEFATLLAPSLMAEGGHSEAELAQARLAADEAIREIGTLKRDSAGAHGEVVDADTIQFGRSELRQRSAQLERPSRKLKASASDVSERSALRGPLLALAVLLLLALGLGAYSALRGPGEASAPTSASETAESVQTQEPASPPATPEVALPVVESPEIDPPPPPATRTAPSRPAVAQGEGGSAVRGRETSRLPGPKAQVVAVDQPPGVLKIKPSRPDYGWVWIDGKKKKGFSTPVMKGMELEPGRHVVQLESHSELGKLGKKKLVFIESGKVSVLGKYDFDREQWSE